jgi:hypothetical protein
VRSHGLDTSIITHLHNKLTIWKAKNLSFAERVTLAKSVIGVIPIYTIMTTSIHKLYFFPSKKKYINQILLRNLEVAKRFYLGSHYGREALSMLLVGIALLDRSIWRPWSTSFGHHEQSLSNEVGVGGAK